MERFVNVRFVTGAALALALGVTLASVTNNLILRIIIPIVTMAVGIFLLVFVKKNGASKVMSLIFVSLISFAVGFGVMTADLYDRGEYDGYAQVDGRICEVEAHTFLIDDIEINGRRYSGKMRIYTDESLEKGNNVTFCADVQTYEIDLFDSSSASRFNDRIYYYAKDPEGFHSSTGKLKLFEKLAKRMSDPLFKFMDKEDAGVAQSLLFGDKSNMTEDDTDIFRVAGLSHVFAVSGMHVGFLTAMVLFLLKRLKVKPLLRLITVSVFVLLYGFLTGFPSGIKRAFIMAFVCMLAPIVRRKNDMVTSLSCATLIIIITNPRELFDVGFLMSVLSIAGIILFARPMRRFAEKYVKNGIARKVIASASITMGANAMLLPIYADVFGNVALYSVLANLIVLPIVTLTYSLLALIAFICAISPAFGVLYYPLQYPITAIRLISVGIASLPYASVSISALGAVGIIYLLTVIFISPINKSKPLPKVAFTAVSSVLSTLLLILL